MDITLPKAVLDDLPAPDQNGLVRVTVALRVKGNEAELVEVNDTPMPGDDESASGDAAADDSGGEMPSPNAVEQSTY